MFCYNGARLISSYRNCRRPSAGYWEKVCLEEEEGYCLCSLLCDASWEQLIG